MNTKSHEITYHSNKTINMNEFHMMQSTFASVIFSYQP